jgi:arylsulfatase A-like enzyme
MSRPPTVVRHVTTTALVAVALAAALDRGLTGRQAPVVERVMLVVVDGLRPDQVTAAGMPRLSALGERGMVFTAHHAAVPTVTRVNAPTIATGAYPETHGLLGNAVYSPATFAAKGVDTSRHDELEAMTTAEGRLLTTTTLGEALAAAGKRLAVFSAGSSGSALLLAAPFAAGTRLVNPEVQRPALPSGVAYDIGPGPKEAVPNAARNRWVVDAWQRLGPSAAADVTIVWFADPDETGHATGLGSDRTAQALAQVDVQIGRIEAILRARGHLATSAILVTSDHGFSTHGGTFALGTLVAPFAQPLPDGAPDLLVTDGAIHARRPLTPARLEELVAALQARPDVGAIFTAPVTPASDEGVVPGTLSFRAAHWQHARSGVALVSANWSHAANAAGIAGTTTQSGTAGHGSTSPYDIRNTLIGTGGRIRVNARGRAPTSNADLAPTVLTLLGLDPPAAMTGRTIRELFTDGPAPASVEVMETRVTSVSANGRYAVTARFSTVDGRRYLDQTEVRRAP